MSAPSEGPVLVGEVEAALEVAGTVEAYYDEFTSGSLNRSRPSREDRIVLAEIFANYYTALETLFLRISQAFENSLDAARWHADLLDKMTIHVEGVRPRVIADQTRDNLRELMRFRHFKRYYLEFDYDWDKLQFLEKKFNQSRPVVRADVWRFLEQLRGG
jgi:hypothetical protein